MSPHSDTLSWFRANQFLLFLIRAACLAERQEYNFIVFGMTQLRLEPTIYRTLGDHANHYTTDVVLTFQDSIIDHLDGH